MTQPTLGLGFASQKSAGKQKKIVSRLFKDEEDLQQNQEEDCREWFEMAEAGMGEGRIFGARNQNQYLIFSKAQM